MSDSEAADLPRPALARGLGGHFHLTHFTDLLGQQILQSPGFRCRGVKFAHQASVLLRIGRPLRVIELGPLEKCRITRTCEPTTAFLCGDQAKLGGVALVAFTRRLALVTRVDHQHLRSKSDERRQTIGNL